MNLNAWTVDLDSRCAVHESGFRLEVEGNPRDPSAVHPGKFPVGMTAIEQVRLLRLGVEAIAEAAKLNAPGRAPVTPRVQKSYKRPADSAPRATLSLKRKTTPEEN